MATSTEDKIYIEAMIKVDDLVQDVFNMCEQIADQNNYEKAWVIDRFKEKFNRAKRENLG